MLFDVGGELQSMFDTTVPAGCHYYWKSAGLRELDDDVIDPIVEHSMRTQSPRSYTIMFHLGGAVAEVDPGATAYAHRHIAHEININAVWLPHQPIGETERRWAREFAAAIGPAADGVYVNFLDRDDAHREADAFGETTYPRLLALRHRYDPDGVFLKEISA